MTIPSEEADAPGASFRRPVIQGGADPAPEHGHSHHNHKSARRSSLFLASAFDRLILAIVLIGMLWIGVIWAVA